jgi:isoleucyl-tRNA synthetase
LTPDLINEGIAKELVNRIQNRRKDSDFNVTDRIKIELTDHEHIREAVQQYGDYIKNEVLADSLELKDNDGDGIELPGEINLDLKLTVV